MEYPAGTEVTITVEASEGYEISRVQIGNEKISEFSDPAKYQKKIDQILSLLAEKDKALEINTSGLRQKLKRTLPDESIVMRYKELGGKLITIGSDAHYAKHLGLGIGKAMDMAKRCGFDSVALFQSRNPMEIPIE